MNIKKILAMIITYNPDISLLKRNLEAVLPQIDKLVIYDNASINIVDVECICKENDDIIHIKKYKKNEGVSLPLYEGILYAKKNGYKYILTLDQDSIIPSNGIKSLYDLILSDFSIGMVGSNVNGLLSAGEKATLITSGTLADVEKVISCGNYNPKLFIDLVDYDICFKMHKAGYKVVVENSVVLEHNFGISKKQKFLGKEFILSNYSPERLYYQTRNWKYMMLLYPEQNKELIAFKKRLNKKLIKAILFERNKIKKICAYLKGLTQNVVKEIEG